MMLLGPLKYRNNNDVYNYDLAASRLKKKFPTNTTTFKLSSAKTEFNKIKNTFPIIRDHNTPVSNKAVESFSTKPSGVDFDIVIDKPFKQESPRSSKTKNSPVIKVGETVKHSDKHVNKRKEIQTVPIENTNNANRNTVQQNNED